MQAIFGLRSMLMRDSLQLGRWFFGIAIILSVGQERHIAAHTKVLFTPASTAEHQHQDISQESHKKRRTEVLLFLFDFLRKSRKNTTNGLFFLTLNVSRE